MEEGREAIVVDLGTQTTRVGVAGESTPECSFRSVTGTPKDGAESFAPRAKYLGNEVQQYRHLLSLKYPVAEAFGQQFSPESTAGLEEFLDFALLEQLHFVPEEQGLFLTHPVNCSRKVREAIAEIACEHYNCPKFQSMPSGLAGYMYHSRGVCCCIDIGHSQTSVYPIWEIHTNLATVRSIPIGGKVITEFLAARLRQRGINFSTPSELELLDELKQQHTRVAGDFEKELFEYYLKGKPTPEAQLPDGSLVSIGPESFLAAEVLFQPSLAGFQFPGIQHLIVDCIEEASIDIRKDLRGNMCLVGGGSLVEGLVPRLTQEITALSPITNRCRVIAPDDRKTGPWQGASLLASLSTCWWVSREQSVPPGLLSPSFPDFSSGNAQLGI